MDKLLANCISIRVGKGLISSSKDLYFIYTACRLGAVRIIYSPTNQQPVGYVVFARVNRSTFYSWTLSTFDPKFESEWMDGYLPVVLDVVFANGFTRYCKSQLRLILEKEKIFFFSRRNTIKACKFVNGKINLLMVRPLRGGGVEYGK